MQLTTDLTTWPDTTANTRLITRSRNVVPVNEEAATATETEGSPFTTQKELSPEEEQRVRFLQNLLSQTLAMAEGNPTDEQRSRIRDIENELEKITGVKCRSRLSSMAARLPGKKDKKVEDDEEREDARQYQGIDPKEAAHARRSTSGQGDNPGMQMLRANALFTAVGALDLSALPSGN